MTALRPDLPPLPVRMRALPIDERGYPVPWFVAWLDDRGVPTRVGDGKPDFRVIGPGRIGKALTLRSCWICGEPLGGYKAFVVGPMCAVNRVSSEPPSHLDCADFSARACPFLANPKRRRNEHDKPEASHDAAGCPIDRNPGVALVWTTKTYRVVRLNAGDGPGNAGVLLRMGAPESVRWYREGRPATRAEVVHSIDTGLPILREMAAKAGPSDLAFLEHELASAMRLVPAETFT